MTCYSAAVQEFDSEQIMEAWEMYLQRKLDSLDPEIVMAGVTPGLLQTVHGWARDFAQLTDARIRVLTDLSNGRVWTQLVDAG